MEPTQAAQPPVRQTELLPNWQELLGDDWSRWERALASAKGPRVLIATSLGGFLPGSLIESLLGVALTVRGAQVEVLLCDGLLPACTQANYQYFAPNDFAQNGIASLCQECFAPVAPFFQTLGVPLRRYSKLVTPPEQHEAESVAARVPYTEIANFRWQDLAVGEHAYASALRYFARGDLANEPFADILLRRYLKAAMLTVFATRRLLAQRNFDIANFHHGIYVPQGLIGEVARQNDVRVVNWNPGYRKQCFIFSQQQSYHYVMPDESTASWESMPWTQATEAELLNYLSSRWDGSQDWIWSNKMPEANPTKIAEELGLDRSRPLIGLLTNVLWDAQLFYRTNAFPNLIEWVVQTIRYFERRPDLQLVIRVHPAEVSGTLATRQPVLPEIRAALPELPSNVFMIPPESPISTYAVMQECDTVLIYGTKMGTELTSVGIPVIVAGEAWVRNKGITMDATTADEYFSLLDRLPLGARLDAARVERARRYAYHFFFRRMIPLEFIEPIGKWPFFQIQISGLDDLLPGRSPGLDVICDGILKNHDFIYPAERFTLQPVALP